MTVLRNGSGRDVLGYISKLPANVWSRDDQNEGLKYSENGVTVYLDHRRILLIDENSSMQTREYYGRHPGSRAEYVSQKVMEQFDKMNRKVFNFLKFRFN